VTVTTEVPAGVVEVVEIVKIAAMEVAPGVTGFGLKLHCAPGGSPEHESVTGFAKAAPTGATVKAYGPVVPPAVTVLLAVEEFRTKF
jgi:hypothetical protein